MCAMYAAHDGELTNHHQRNVSRWVKPTHHSLKTVTLTDHMEVKTMSDLCGQADRQIELHTNVAIQNARYGAHQPRELQPCGYCHNCGDLVDQPRKLFCDLECSQDHEKRTRK